MRENHLTQDNQTEICFFKWHLKSARIKCISNSFEILGLKSGNDFSLDGLLKITHIDDRVLVKEELDSALNRKSQLNFEFRIFLPDKSIRWITCKTNFITETNSIPDEILGVFFDTTPARLTKEILLRTQYTVDHARDTMFWIDETGKIIYANDTASKVLGYTKDELQRMNILDIDPLIKRENWKEHWEKTLNKESYVIQSIHKKKNGELFPVEVSINVMTFDGKVYHSSIARDISERKSLENEIRESEEKYRNIFNNSPLGIYRTSPDGKVIEANPAILSMLGCSSIEELQQKNLDYSNSFSSKSPRKKFKELIEKNGSITGYESIWLKNDGTEVFVRENAKAIKDESGKIIYYDGTVEDITDIILAQNKLHESEKLYRTLAESAKYFIVVVDKNFKVKFINSYLAEKLEVNPEEIIGLPGKAIFPSSASNYLLAFVKKVCKDNIVLFDENHLNIGNDLFWISSQFIPLIDDSGSVHSVLCLGHDITERKKSEQNILAAKERAEEMNRLKTHFLTNMSHELRTPLFGIIGFSELLQYELKNSEHLEMVKGIFESGKRLSETLNSMLDLSKIESNNIELKPVDFDLVPYCNQILDNFNNSISKKGLYFKKEYHIQKLNVYMDKKALETVIYNLLNNAVKFTKYGGIAVNISLEKNNPEVLVLKVSDTGIGIAKENYDIIFEEFRQVSEGFNRNFEGSGLGLSITKKIVDKLNGRISVESEVEKGTTFIVKIPLITVPDLSNKKSERDSASQYNTVNAPSILLVDDDENVRTILTTFLTPSYNIIHVPNAVKALAKVKNEKFDCIIMDINLGEGMDGVTATREIKKLKNYKSVPIVACTAYALAGDKEEFIAAGCTHYLSKPFRKNEIMNLMREIFSNINIPKIS